MPAAAALLTHRVATCSPTRADSDEADDCLRLLGVGPTYQPDVRRHVDVELVDPTSGRRNEVISDGCNVSCQVFCFDMP